MAPENPVIPLEDAVKGLEANISDAEWLLKHIESQDGWFRFPAYVTNLIANLRLESYPLLYVSESAIGAAVFLGFMTKEELQDLAARLDRATLEERAEFLTEVEELLSEFVEGFHIPQTPAEQEAARNRFLALPEDEQRQSVKVSQHFLLSFLPAFHQCLSIMVHGEKLTSLVAQAESGDDDAFVKAVQIDRRILTEMPYFKSRYALAQNQEKGSDFFDKLAYRLKSPPYRGKIRHKTLWWTFSILEQAGWLNHRKRPTFPPGRRESSVL